MPDDDHQHARAPAATYDVAVIGAGPAGCAAALAARRAGAARVLLADMADRPGGAISAMGMRYNLPTETTLAQAGIDQYYRTTLIRIANDRRLTLLGPRGMHHVVARVVVLATGGREQTRGGLAVPGTRPAGVLTAGAALRLLAATGRPPGRRVVLAGTSPRMAARTSPALTSAHGQTIRPYAGSRASSPSIASGSLSTTLGGRVRPGSTARGGSDSPCTCSSSATYAPIAGAAESPVERMPATWISCGQPAAGRMI